MGRIERKLRRRAPSSLTRAVYEAYAGMQLLCMIGYDPAAIMIQAANVLGEGLCATVLLTCEGKQFRMPVAPLTEEQVEQFRDAALRFFDAKPHMSRAALDRIVEESKIWGRKVEVLAAMHAKGFDIHRYKLREAN